MIGASKKRRIRRRLYVLQEGLCYLCGESMNNPDDRIPGSSMGHPRDATLDHVVARAVAGTDALTNLRLACLECNARKAEKTFFGHLAGDVDLKPSLAVVLHRRNRELLAAARQARDAAMKGDPIAAAKILDAAIGEIGGADA